MLSIVFKPIAFKAAKLHLAAVGQPKTEKQQLRRQLIRMLAVFSARNVHETASSQKYFTEKFSQVKISDSSMQRFQKPACYDAVPRDDRTACSLVLPVHNPCDSLRRYLYERI